MKTKFYDRVLKALDGHWYWTLYINPDGYGRCSARKRNGEFAHRVAWELDHGPIPEGMVIDHLCGVRDCVRLTHLEVVTPTENVRRSNAKQTHCKQGHKFTGETRNNQRICRLCLTEATHRYREKQYNQSKNASAS